MVSDKKLNTLCASFGMEILSRAEYFFLRRIVENPKYVVLCIGRGNDKMNKFNEANKIAAKGLKYGDTNGLLEMFLIHLPFAWCLVRSCGKIKLANKYKWVQSIK